MRDLEKNIQKIVHQLTHPTYLKPPHWRDPVHVLAFGLGLGASPIIPGTCGTLLGVILYALNAYFFQWSLLLCILIGFGVGIYLCGKTERDLGVPDHPGIVWDEVVGYWVTMLGVPLGLGWMLYGFVLFRIFDIAKPWPIWIIDKHLPGGLGVMLDDVLAGLYALLVIHVTIFFC